MLANIIAFSGEKNVEETSRGWTYFLSSCGQKGKGVASSFLLRSFPLQYFITLTLPLYILMAYQVRFQQSGTEQQGSSRLSLNPALGDLRHLLNLSELQFPHLLNWGQ